MGGFGGWRVALAVLPALAVTLGLVLVRRRRRLGKRVSLVVKLGGSAVTNKSTFETLNTEKLEATAKSLARSPLARETVLLHGAGSFGHFQASKYAISRGTSSAQFSWLGFAETRSSVTRLNTMVVSALLEHGLPACSMPPFPRWSTRAKQHVVQDGSADVLETLSAGLLPVLHGDAVLDDAQGTAILSGDALVVHLCDALRPDVAVFLTDVPGGHQPSSCCHRP